MGEDRLVYNDELGNLGVAMSRIRALDSDLLNSVARIAPEKVNRRGRYKRKKQKPCNPGFLS